MSYRLPRYRVALVREGCSYTDKKTVHSPEDVHAIVAAEYADAVVEMAILIAYKYSAICYTKPRCDISSGGVLCIRYFM